MRWKPDRRSSRAERLISEAYARRIEEVALPPYPAYGRAGQEVGTRRRRDTWASPGRVRAANLTFALFFALSCSVVAANLGRPSLLATSIVPNVVAYQFNEKLPQALETVQSLVGPGLIGGVQ